MTAYPGKIDDIYYFPELLYSQCQSYQAVVGVIAMFCARSLFPASSPVFLRKKEFINNFFAARHQGNRTNPERSLSAAELDTQPIYTGLGGIMMPPVHIIRVSDDSQKRK